MTTETTLPIGKWIRLTSLGWLLGVILVLAFSAAFEGLGFSKQFPVGLGMGAGVGLLQWRYLHKRVGMNKTWIWYSVAGMTVPFIVFDIWAGYSVPIASPGDYLPYTAGAGSLFISLLQFGMLRKRFNKMAAWVPLSFLGWFAATSGVFLINYTNKLGLPNIMVLFLNLFLMLAGGLILGLCTAPLIRRLTPVGATA